MRDIYEHFDHTSLSSGLDYIAYDGADSDKADCIAAVARIYGTPERRYFNDAGELMGTFDAGSFDTVVMCNVLHEIAPECWLELFSLQGAILTLLMENGFLLLVEDNQIPIGEKPHQKGFLVLDTPQLKNLFCIKEADKGFECFQKKEGRLKAHKISKDLLKRITPKSRQQAIRGIAQTAKEKIKLLRKEPGTYQNGRLHAFWLQQFANAQLTMEQNEKL